MTRCSHRWILAWWLAAFALLSLPSAGRSEQAGRPRLIGVMLVSISPQSQEAQAFRQALRDAGYVEGSDIVIEWRAADGDYGQVPALVADLVRRKVQVIVVNTTIATRAVKQATSSIPVVMAIVADPLGSGLVSNLAHPGGNVTGLSMMSPELSKKHLELIKECVPKLTRVAAIWNPDTPFHSKTVEELKAAAPSLGVEVNLLSARTPEEIGPALFAAKRGHAQALYVLNDPQFVTHRKSILEFASKAKLPTIYGVRQFVDDGGLISYGPSLTEQFRRAAGYVDKILKGAIPGDLPVEQPTRFELVINLKTANALGLELPQSILQRADDVIR